MDDTDFAVSVVYALPERQIVVELKVPPGATVLDAVRGSGLQQRFAEIGDTPACAIFGRAVSSDTLLAMGDRVEILRSLLIDPKENRRRAAAANRARNRR